MTEFTWIRDEAFSVPKEEGGVLPATLQSMFSENAHVTSLESLAKQAVSLVDQLAAAVTAPHRPGSSPSPTTRSGRTRLGDQAAPKPLA